MQNSLVKIILVVFITLLASCSSKKNIIYVQGFDELEDTSVKYIDYKLQSNDLLKIDINSDNPETLLAFNPKALNTNSTTNKESLKYNGYIIDSNGYVILPSLGKIHVVGKTVEQVRDQIYNKLIDDDVFILFSVDVKHLNSGFTVIGEVNSPGNYEFLTNNMNILKALGLAGDLTIFGKRDDVKIIRNVDGSRKVFSVDLTSSKSIMNNYQIFPNDIIIVNPNSTRVKNAGIIGNSGTLLSLLSFLLSSIIIINN